MNDMSEQTPGAPAGTGPLAGPAPTVGLAVGRGTGEEVAAVFTRVLGHLATRHERPVTLVRSPRVYHSYVSLRPLAIEPGGAGVPEIRRLSAEDAAHYEDWLRARAAVGTRVVFRTAINAQSLYLVRQRLRAVKVDTLDADGARMLLVRDEAQGFYTGGNTHTPGHVSRTTEFSREITEQLLAYALRRAREEWPEGPARIVMAYKFHLLDGALDAWVRDFAAREGIEVGVFQPDTVNRNLVAHRPEDRTVLLAGNEWADIMHLVLLDRYGSGRQEDHCTRNVHLDPDVAGLVEYQTVHGSADDLEGRDLLNPVATLRAAAAIAERYVGCTGAEAATEAALARLGEAGIRTPDQGGKHSTTGVVDAFLEELGAAHVPVAPESPASGVALAAASLAQAVVPAPGQDLAPGLAR
ncbi:MULTISPECIES: isocitrate/isopropylmalate family dehydrogenase [unclassified Streptomyces]|uniref:isocitrate/isopropylmalate family dehydrogenase n=1 Tax=unclassified Streptomyces TaxID=2593676 RepID=UPI000BAC6C29|nr:MULTISPECIES: isocitrate/isopropylmalate family dehydrogenase [unclassified Streptomyces]ASY34936.1 isocitrate dehydrogenase [Streptomyces sp. CLI2509]MYX23815.1 isocitrate dehydrogenase [Streptomyces sp. SID8380]